MSTAWWVVLAISLLLFAGGILNAYSEHRWLSRAEFTRGKVVELIVKRGAKSRNTFAPKVQFQDPNGNAQSFVSNMSSSPPAYKVGESVHVAYDPADVGSATIASFGARFGVSVVLVCLGIFGALLTTGFVIGPKVVPAMYLPPPDDPWLNADQ